MGEPLTLRDKLTMAIADPGAVLPREAGETVARWGARAVEAVLSAERAPGGSTYIRFDDIVQEGQVTCSREPR